MSGGLHRDPFADSATYYSRKANYHNNNTEYFYRAHQPIVCVAIGALPIFELWGQELTTFQMGSRMKRASKTTMVSASTEIAKLATSYRRCHCMQAPVAHHSRSERWLES